MSRGEAYIHDERREYLAHVLSRTKRKDYENYDIGVPNASYYICTIDTESNGRNDEHARQGKIYKVQPGSCNGFDQHITVPLPKLSGMILERR